MSNAFRLVLVLFVVLGTGCDLFGEDDRDDAEQVSRAKASFGLRAIYGLNPEAAGGPNVLAAQFYRDGEYHSPLGGSRAVFKVNGVPVSEEGFAFEYDPEKEYAFEASLDGESIQAELSAPSVSSIQFIDVPDSVCDNRPVTLRWGYPNGERNDGILMLTTSAYSSGHLEPSTTSHTIPANRLWHGRQRVQVMTIRSVLFRNLAWKEQENVEWGMGYAGSFITLFLISAEYEFEVLQSEYDQNCQASGSKDAL